MSSITIKMKDGSVKDFPETSRAGGSYCTSIKYESGFAIVTDAWGKQTAVPAESIDEVVVEPNTSGRW